MRNVSVCLFVAFAGCAPATAVRVTSATVSRNEPRAFAEERLDLYQRAHALEMEGRCDEARSTYAQYANSVRAFDAESARLAMNNANLCWTPARPDPTLSDAITAILSHDPARALALLNADQTVSPWRDYNRGVALSDLRRTDDAAAAFDRAERELPPSDIMGRSIALYGKARAYHDALRCTDAWSAYEAFATLVRDTQPAQADMALACARDCIKR